MREVHVFAPEALRAEAVLDRPRERPSEARSAVGALGVVRAGEAEAEAISEQVTQAQLVAVARDLEHLERAPRRRGELRERRLVREPHAEPLPRDRRPVLAPRVAHVAARAPGRAQQGVDHVVGVQPPSRRARTGARRRRRARRPRARSPGSAPRRHEVHRIAPTVGYTRRREATRRSLPQFSSPVGHTKFQPVEQVVQRCAGDCKKRATSPHYVGVYTSSFSSGPEQPAVPVIPAAYRGSDRRSLE